MNGSRRHVGGPVSEKAGHSWSIWVLSSLMRSFSESAKALERTFFISMSEMSSMKSVFQSSGALSNLIMGYTSASPWSYGFLITRPSRIWAAVLPLTTTSFFPSLCTDSNLVDTGEFHLHHEMFHILLHLLDALPSDLRSRRRDRLPGVIVDDVDMCHMSTNREPA